MSKLGYGYFVFGGAADFRDFRIFRRPAGRSLWARVIIDLCLAIVTVMVFANLFIMKSFPS